MSDVYSFRPGPTFRTASPAEMFTAAMDQPMSIMSTLTDQAKGGVLESFGLGTAIRDFNMPEEAPTAPDVVVTPEDGAPINLPDTASTRRRQTIVNTPVGGGQAPAPVLESPDAFQQRRVAAKALDEDQYKASAFYRKDIPWDPGMTEDRAAVLASFYDAKKVREFYAEKRPIASFLGNLAGQALDPINYIPIVGPEVRAASVARFGALKSGAALGALDAAANTAAASVATLDARRSYGDDVSWQTTISQIATAALIGGAFGTLGGALGERADVRNRKAIEDRMSTLKTTQEARVALNEAIGGLARDGEIKLSPNATEPMARVADEINPAKSPDLFAGLERQDLFSTTAVGQLVDNRPTHVQDFEVTQRNQILADNPVLAQRFTEAEAKFNEAQARVAAIEEPISARTQADAVSLVDPVSGERVRQIEADLAKNPSTAKRAALEAERTSIVESIGPDAIAKAENDFRIGPTKKAKDARKALASTRQEYSKARREVDTIAARQVAEDRVRAGIGIDASPPRPEPIPEGRKEAESSIAKPDDYKAMAAQYRIDAETGSYHEEPDIKQLETEGRLTDEDKAALDDAQKTYENGAAYGDALKAAVGCLIS